MEDKTKICKDCKIDKPISEFRLKKKRQPTGTVTLYRYSFCFHCEKIRQRLYYKEKMKDARYRNKNVERVKRWRQKNPESRKQEHKRWRERNPTTAAEKKAISDSFIAWRAANPQRAKVAAEKLRKKHLPDRAQWQKQKLKEDSAYRERQLENVRKYNKKSSAELHDNYIRKLLIAAGIDKKYIQGDIIECWKILIKIKRYVKQKATNQQKAANHGKTNDQQHG